MNAFLCGLRTSVFFVIREAIRGFSFNHNSRRGIATCLNPRHFLTQSRRGRRGRTQADGMVFPCLALRTLRLCVRYCLVCYWLLDPTLVAPLGALVVQRQVMWLAALAS